MCRHLFLCTVVVLASVSLSHVAKAQSAICDDIQPGLWVRDTQDCTVAYQCDLMGDVSQKVQCNESQIWSVLSNACVWEGDPDRDDCHGNPFVPVKNHPDCIRKNGNNPDPEDCSRFISCSNSTLIAKRKCGEGTLYYSRNDSCEFSHIVARDCGKSKIPQHMMIPKPDPECHGYGDARVPHPKNPCSFIHCYMGKILKMETCPRGTSYSVGKGYCEWSKLKCGRHSRTRTDQQQHPDPVHTQQQWPRYDHINWWEQEEGENSKPQMQPKQWQPKQPRQPPQQQHNQGQGGQNMPWEVRQGHADRNAGRQWPPAWF